MTGATKEVDTDWMASSQFGATKDGDAEGMQPEDGTCMARGHMGAAHAAAFDALVIFLTRHCAIPFTAQRLPGSVEGEITIGHLMVRPAVPATTAFGALVLSTR